MKGFSISVVTLDKEIEEALTSTSDPSAWFIREYGKKKPLPSPKLPDMLPFDASKNERFDRVFDAIVEELISAEKELNAIDEKVGDGDAGSTFAAGAKKLKKLKAKLPLADTGELFITIGRILARETGGSSGVLLSILFTRAGNSYKKEKHLGKALLEGLEKMKEIGGARESQRTMVDAMQPAFEVLSEDGNLETAAQKAREGANKTKDITQTDFGRSSYLSEKDLKGVLDPGAEAVARVFERAVKAL